MRKTVQSWNIRRAQRAQAKNIAASHKSVAQNHRSLRRICRLGFAVVVSLLFSSQVSVPAYAELNPECVSDCSTLTIVNAVTGGTATPADWALGATADSDTYTFTSGVSKSVGRNRTYTLTSTGGPADYTQSFACTGNSNVTFNDTDHTVTFPNQSGRNATCTFTYTYVSSDPIAITVHAGGVRTGSTTVAPIPDGAVFTATPVSGSPAGGPFTCTVTNGAGTCDIEVPAGFAWNIAPTIAPSGYYLNPSLDYGSSSTVTPDTYSFRTGIVNANIDVPGVNPNGTYADIRHPGANYFSGLFASSVINPLVAQKCGLNVALVLDQSGSMAGAKQTTLKAAANDTITALTGTPSTLAIYTFASTTGASVASTSTVTSSSAAPLHSFVNGLGTPTGSTNWDAGLYQVSNGYDLVILLTDGNPTTYGNNAGVGNESYFQYVDHGIFSANHIKSSGTALVAVGVGINGATENLRAVSGTTENADYYLATSTSFGDVLKALATGTCSSQLTIRKQIQDPSGALLTNSVLANGWNFTNTISAGSTIDGTATTTQVNDQNGFASAGVDIPAGENPTITVTEALDSEYTLVSAQCTVDGVPVTTTVDGATASFTGQANVPMSCSFINRQKEGHWTLAKSSNPASGSTVDRGSTVTYTLSASNPSAATVLDAIATDDLSGVLDDATLGSLPAGLSQVGNTLTWNVGQLAAGQTKTISFTVTVNSDAYGASLDNVVTAGELGACISQSGCETTHSTLRKATLTLMKSVNNSDTGGTASSADWTLSADGGSGGSTITDSASGVVHTVLPGEYRLSESEQLSGYTVQGTWMCIGQDPVSGMPESNLVQVEAGQDVVCTITNAAVKSSLTLNKTVVNGSTGATHTVADWTLSASGPTSVSGVASGTKTFVAIGNYTLSESGPDGYLASAWDCGDATVRDGVVAIPLGDNVSCTITNTAIAPTLTLNKAVNNGSTGATHTAADWALSATGPSSVTEVTSGTKTTVKVGSYTLSESGPDGYSASAWDCGDANVVDGVVTIELGEDVTCAIANTAIAPTLTLNKTVVNGSTGATHTAADWALSATGPSSVTDVTSGTKTTVKVGSYTLSESGPDGYSASAWDCGDANVVAGVVTVELGEDVSCSITNTAIPPTLTLSKTVENGQTGATHVPSDWKLSASGPTSVTDVTSGTKTTVKVGGYTLSESGPNGYSASAWDCGDATVRGGVVTVDLGEDVTCTITNTAIPPTLTLNKTVENGQTGATHVPSDWKLSASGPTSVTDVSSGTKSTVAIGNYILRESGPDGYAASTWDCGDANVVDGVVAVELGEDVTCTVTNTATAASITLIKAVDNGQTGATHVPSDWKLSATGPSSVTDVTSGTKTTVKVGNYTLSESGPDGYSASTWDCGDVTVRDGVVTVELGEDVTCTITNTAIPPTLTLNKTVENGQTGAQYSAQDWALSASGPTAIANVTSGTKTTVQVGNYTLSETGPSGYAASAWDCGDATVVDGIVTVELGQDVTCEVTNTAIEPVWQIQKTSNPATGSSVLPGESITYKLTLNHLSGVVPTDVVITDDLSGVLNNATLDDISTTFGSASLVGGILTWHAGAVAGVATLSYRVTVNADAYGVTLRNVVTPPDGGSCEQSCETEHFTGHFVLTKTSDPAEGEIVEPGQTVTYTLMATNDSLGTVSGAQVTDDLTDVLDNALLTTPLASGLVLEADGKTLTWSIPDLASGASASVSYMVTVNTDAFGEFLTNVATPGSGGQCPVDDSTPTLTVQPNTSEAILDCSTSHYVNALDLVLTKAHTIPTDGVPVDGAGPSSITYELTIVNNGQLAGVDDAPNAIVTDLLDSHLTLVPESIVAPDWDTSESTASNFQATYIANGGVFAAGGTSKITFTVNITTPIDFAEITNPVIANTACVATEGIEVTTANNCGSDETLIEAVALDPLGTCRNDAPTMDYNIPLYDGQDSEPITVALIWWAPNSYQGQDEGIDATDQLALLEAGALQVDYVVTPDGWQQGDPVKGWVYWPGVRFNSEGSVTALPGRIQTSDGRWILDATAPYYNIHSSADVEVRLVSSSTGDVVRVAADETCYPRTGILALTGADASHWPWMSFILGGFGFAAVFLGRRRWLG